MSKLQTTFSVVNALVYMDSLMFVIATIMLQFGIEFEIYNNILIFKNFWAFGMYIIQSILSIMIIKYVKK